MPTSKNSQNLLKIFVFAKFNKEYTNKVAIFCTIVKVLLGEIVFYLFVLKEKSIEK